MMLKVWFTVLFALGFGTTVVFASSHWLLAWIGLEINVIAFIALVPLSSSPRYTEAMTKYFLVQAAAAGMLLFATISNAWISGQWGMMQLNEHTPVVIAILALALKLGVAPLHIWMPEVLQCLPYRDGLILLTWQKLAPFYLLLHVGYDTNLLLILGLLSILIGGWGGLNNTKMRKIVAYSSIANMGWMMLTLQSYPSLSFIVLILYFVVVLALMEIIKMVNGTSINSLASSWSKSPIISSMLPLILLSTGGLPPLTGFMPKWLILQELTKQDLAPLATLAALSSLLSLYFYLRVSYAMTLTISPNIPMNTLPWRLSSNQHTLTLAFATSISLCLLPLTPAILAFLTL
uniref:NADH dehydrogenase subunit 2 n=1 Tax=Fundulus luciae TaxID=722635 RepID=UPI0028D77665|nr:NADH dehydrogenase subunit 2 [Fundulus luciae]WMY89851.1 NADH dehydrogenase subunit 2 [Fundulus luciae]